MGHIEQRECIGCHGTGKHMLPVRATNDVAWPYPAEHPTRVEEHECARCHGTGVETRYFGREPWTKKP